MKYKEVKVKTSDGAMLNAWTFPAKINSKNQDSRFTKRNLDFQASHCQDLIQKSRFLKRNFDFALL